MKFIRDILFFLRIIFYKLFSYSVWCKAVQYRLYTNIDTENVAAQIVLDNKLPVRL